MIHPPPVFINWQIRGWLSVAEMMKFEYIIVIVRLQSDLFMKSICYNLYNIEQRRNVVW